MESVLMSPGLMIFTYVLMFFAGITTGAGITGGLYLYRRYKELLFSVQNFELKDIVIED